MNKHGFGALVFAAVLGSASSQAPRAQTASAPQASGMGTRVESAASIIGPLDAVFAKCKILDADRLAQYQEAEQFAYAASRTDELQSIRLSAAYSAIVDEAARRMDGLDRARLMKSCESLLTQANRARTSGR